MSWPVVSNDERVQSLYEEIRAGGESHRFAEMIALRRGPALDTDTRFLAGRDDGNGHGYYSHQTQSVIRSKADIKRHCERTGSGCETLGIKYRQPEVDPLDAPYRPADDILETAVNERVKNEFGGNVSASKRAILKEEAAVVHGQEP